PAGQRLPRGDPPRRRRRVGNGRLSRPVPAPANGKPAGAPGGVRPRRERCRRPRGPSRSSSSSGSNAQRSPTMKGDFSRDTFNPGRPFSRVLRQQGRVDLDSDWNEQVASLLQLDRQLTGDLLGWHGTFDAGFRITGATAEGEVVVTPGSYYA